MLPKDNRHNADLSKSGIRWKILIRTLQKELDDLSGVNFGDDKMQVIGSSSPDPVLVLASMQDMLSDLQKIAVERQAMIKPGFRDQQFIASTKRSSTDTLEKSGLIAVEGAFRPDIPRPAISILLSEEVDRYETVQMKISDLGPQASAKVHRSLLEERNTIQTCVERLNKEIEAITAECHDLMTIGSPIEICDSIRLICTQYHQKKMDVFLFFRNLLAHSIILAILENLIDPNSSQKTASSVVDRILEISSVAADKFVELSLVTNSVLDQPAITRLDLPAHLSKQVNRRYQDRYASFQTFDPSEEKKKATSPAKSKQHAKKLARIEYWILSRTWVSDDELLTDSFAIRPPSEDETRKQEQVNSSQARQARPESLEPADAHQSVATCSPEADRSRSEHSDDDEENGMLDLPSAPSSALPLTRDKGSDTDTDSVDETEAQRLIQMFASSPTSSHHDSDDEGEPDLSELNDLTPAEQEEVLKALASAEEHYLATNSGPFKDDQTVDELLQEAKNELKRFGGSRADEEAPVDRPDLSAKDKTDDAPDLLSGDDDEPHE